jgi:hypothetical protein
MDLVIANIPSNLQVPYVSNLTFSIPFLNQSVNNFINSIILFFDNFLSENGAMLLFHSDDLHVLQEIQSFLENSKIWMKWFVINSFQ